MATYNIELKEDTLQSNFGEILQKTKLSSWGRSSNMQQRDLKQW